MGKGRVSKINSMLLFAVTSIFVSWMHAVATVSRRAEQGQKPDIQLQNAIHHHILSADCLSSLNPSIPAMSQ
jgi:hypothetical protein